MVLSKHVRYEKVIIVSLGHLFHDIYAAFLSPVLPLLVEKLGITLSMAGLLDIFRNAPSLFNPFLGLIIDRFPVRFFVACMPGVTAVAMCLLGLAPSYGVVIILIIVAGISSTLFHIPSPVLIKRFAAQRSGTGMSFYMLGGELSRTLGPLVITGAITLWGFEGTWRLIPFGLAASAVLFWRLGDGSKDADIPSRRTRPKAGAAIREIRHHLVFIGIFLFFSLGMKVSATLYLAAYLVHQGRTLVSAGIFLSVLQFSGAAGTLCAGYVADKIGKRITLLSSALACPAFLLLFIYSGPVMEIPAVIGLGFFLFAPGPVILAMVQDAGSSSPSFVNGLYMTVQFAIRSCIVFAVGLGIDILGFDRTYTIAAVMGFGAVPGILFFPVRSVFSPGVDSRKQPS